MGSVEVRGLKGFAAIKLLDTCLSFSRDHQGPMVFYQGLGLFALGFRVSCLAQSRSRVEDDLGLLVLC